MLENISGSLMFQKKGHKSITSYTYIEDWCSKPMKNCINRKGMHIYKFINHTEHQIPISGWPGLMQKPHRGEANGKPKQSTSCCNNPKHWQLNYITAYYNCKR